MAVLDIIDFGGKKVGTAELQDAVFAADVKPYLYSEIVNWQRACKRSGTQSALTKAEVSGTTKKPFPQKGRGCARQGSLKNPHQIGGGVAFAPKPRDYSFSIPKSKKRAALVSVISQKIQEGRFKLIDKISLESPSTKMVSELMKNLSVDSCLLVDGSNDNLKLSARNHSGAKFIEHLGVNVMDILRFPYLVITVDAAKRIEERILG